MADTLLTRLQFFSCVIPNDQRERLPRPLQDEDRVIPRSRQGAFKVGVVSSRMRKHTDLLQNISHLWHECRLPCPVVETTSLSFSLSFFDWFTHLVLAELWHILSCCICLAGTRSRTFFSCFFLLCPIALFCPSVPILMCMTFVFFTLIRGLSLEMAIVVLCRRSIFSVIRKAMPGLFVHVAWCTFPFQRGECSWDGICPPSNVAHPGHNRGRLRPIPYRPMIIIIVFKFVITILLFCCASVIILTI